MGSGYTISEFWSWKLKKLILKMINMSKPLDINPLLEHEFCTLLYLIESISH